MTGIALVAITGLALTGCKSSSTASPAGSKAAGSAASASAVPSVSLPADPKEAVLASTKVLTTTTYRYALKSDELTGQGQVDPVNKKLSMSMTANSAGLGLQMNLVVLGNDGYLKMDLGGNNKTLGIPAGWMHLDASKLSVDSGLGVNISGSDPGDAAGLLKGLTGVQRVDAQHYKATIDLTQATGDSVGSDTLSKLGAKAKALPATITLDDQGRLSDVTVDMTSIDKSLKLELTYSGYGSPVTVNKPTGTIVEAPDTVQQIFAGSK
jgi:hypothetical protein